MDPGLFGRSEHGWRQGTGVNMNRLQALVSGAERTFLGICAGAVLGGSVLALGGGPAAALPGQGHNLVSTTAFCTGLGTVTVTSPPATAITPVAFIDGHVWLTQTETITGPRGTGGKSYGIPTDGRPTTNCTVTFGPVTVTWTAVQVN
jgi:hypothetical protein